MIATPSEPMTSGPAGSDAPVRVTVCTSCRLSSEPALPMEARAGARLFATLSEATRGDPAIELVGVECLSVCKRACTISFAAPGKWTYIYGDLPPETATPVILDALALYGATADGLIPWRLRSDPIRKGVVARLPPFPVRPAPAPEDRA